jgi:hypothetical protein
VPPVDSVPRTAAAPPDARPFGGTSGRTPGRSLGGGDLFSPVTRGTPPEEAVGGTPTSGSPTSGTPNDAPDPEPTPESGAEERPGLVDRAKAQVAGWFEPVTSSQDGGFGPAGSWRDEPPPNGHHQGG